MDRIRLRLSADLCFKRLRADSRNACSAPRFCRESARHTCDRSIALADGRHTDGRSCDNVGYLVLGYYYSLHPDSLGDVPESSVEVIPYTEEYSHVISNRSETKVRNLLLK